MPKSYLMKHFILSLVLLFCSLAMHAQSVEKAKAGDCKKFRNGTFKIVDKKLGNFTIVRKGDMQIETKEGDPNSIIFKVKWLDDCTYTLTPGEGFYKKFPKMPANVVITVNITKTTASSYTQRSTANISTVSIESEVVKVK